jgi:spermidine synthase
MIYRSDSLPRTFAGLFLITLTTLLLELTLIRLLDVLWYPNFAYMVITMAMLAFGLAGVYTSIRPAVTLERAAGRLFGLCVLFCVFTVALYPILNLVTFDFDSFADAPVASTISFVVIYIALAIPFFICGIILTSIFTLHDKHIQRLYFWDLLGAAIGSVILIPLLPRIGPAGLLFVSAGLGAFAAALFAKSRVFIALACVIAIVCIAMPFLKDGYYDFTFHMDKRDIKKVEINTEITVWDPISRIDVINYGRRIKWIAYDGGTQTSYFYQFDGDFEKLRSLLPGKAHDHFWGRIVPVSHYLKRDTNQKVLVIGSAGGQEIKAALTYGAAEVDGIELVGSVVNLGKGVYDKYIGGIFNHPRVNNVKGEGRTFLRSTSKKYDIIQIMSNHTSSSIAAGSGAMASNYLQTADAYREFFDHLTADGILHINHHVYPRMITTAALAWKQMGRGNFKEHVLVFEGQGYQDNLPTLLIKMSPWTQTEVDEAKRYLKIKLVEKPDRFGKSFLSDEFYSGDLSEETIDNIDYRVAPATDDEPYFNFIRKKMHRVNTDPESFMSKSISKLLNSRLQSGIPTDVIHFFVGGGTALVLSIVFLFVPLLYSDVGKSRWDRKGSFVTYFSCLGAGFIIYELIFIQIFMKLIGYPLYTYTTVVFTFLLGAGLGSLFSHTFRLSPDKLWSLPFLGVLVYSCIFLFTYDTVFSSLLTAETWVRVMASIAIILPLTFFLGMPFPLGILAVSGQANGVVAWAWAFNGLFTVVGGLASVLISVYHGLQNTLIVAAVVYLLAWLTYSRMRRPPAPVMQSGAADHGTGSFFG